MRQQYGRWRSQTPMASCAEHGPYPLNFSYRGMGFANACPKCNPSWQKNLRAWRDRMLDGDKDPKGQAHG